MESAQEQVERIVYTTVATITETHNNSDGERSWFVIDNTQARWWAKGLCAFQPGDRVKITITKEPAVDAHI